MFKLCLLVFVALGLGPKAVKGFVGEILAEPYEFPYHVLLKVESEYFCNGALISYVHILTAGYCIEYRNELNGRAFAVLGANYMHDDGVPRRIKDNGIYQNTNVNNLQFNLNIFVLRNWPPVLPHVRPLSFPEPNLIEYGAAAIVSGVGHTYPRGPNNPHIMKLPVQVLDKHTCERKLRCQIQEYQICAEAVGENGLTPGDIGAPLVQNNMVIGVAAGTPIAGEEKPDIYTDTSFYRDWIVQITVTA